MFEKLRLLLDEASQRVVHVFKGSFDNEPEHPRWHGYKIIDWPDENAEKIIASFKGIGWDWAPEKIKRKIYKGAIYYQLSSYHRSEEFEDYMASKGYKIEHIMAKEAIQRLDARIPQYNKEIRSFDPEATYKRLRYLYKHNRSLLNSFEREFVPSVGRQLAQGKKLSDKQRNAVVKVLLKYKIGKEDFASEDFNDVSASIGCSVTWWVDTERSVDFMKWLQSLEDEIDIVDPDYLHCTVLFDKEAEDLLNPIDIPQDITSPIFKPFMTELFGEEENILVVVGNCPEIQARHTELHSLYGYKHSFPFYRPHITISKNASSKVNVPSNMDIYFIKESVQRIDDSEKKFVKNRWR